VRSPAFQARSSHFQYDDSLRAALKAGHSRKVGQPTWSVGGPCRRRSRAPRSARRAPGRRCSRQRVLDAVRMPRAAAVHAAAEVLERHEVHVRVDVAAGLGVRRLALRGRAGLGVLDLRVLRAPLRLAERQATAVGELGAVTRRQREALRVRPLDREVGRVARRGGDAAGRHEPAVPRVEQVAAQPCRLHAHGALGRARADEVVAPAHQLVAIALPGGLRAAGSDRSSSDATSAIRRPGVIRRA
jgi:hypothetical protein